VFQKIKTQMVGNRFEPFRRVAFNEYELGVRISRGDFSINSGPRHVRVNTGSVNDGPEGLNYEAGRISHGYQFPLPIHAIDVFGVMD
jgi:hypothetical protein